MECKGERHGGNNGIAYTRERQAEGKSGTHEQKTEHTRSLEVRREARTYQEFLSSIHKPQPATNFKFTRSTFPYLFHVSASDVLPVSTPFLRVFLSAQKRSTPVYVCLRLCMYVYSSNVYCALDFSRKYPPAIFPTWQ